MLTLSVQLDFLHQRLYSDLLRTLPLIRTSALSSGNFRSVIRYQCNFDLGVAVCNIRLICGLSSEIFDGLSRIIFSLCIKYYSVIICGNDPTFNIFNGDKESSMFPKIHFLA